ncbi:amidohydrolase [Sphingobacterium chungjuense]|uniref:amidohydrolase n=1 Tax=Sphingobacterium chungjuense TaxID=2675553 RepID=UPI00140CD7A6|nr:amidohydrolase [Sphingobacterium chungjuense]
MKSILAALGLLFLFASCTTNHEVDLIVYNARVYTVDSAFTIAEAFAIRGGVFVEIGSSERLLQRYEAKETIDAQGAAVYPGFYDSHTHFLDFAASLDMANLYGAKSFHDVLLRLQAHHKTYPDRPWLVGAGWDQERWDDESFTVRDSLDKYFPDIPVYLSRVDYQAASVNSKALELASIDTAFYVEGGLILTDSLGRLSGVLMDNAMDLVKSHIPEVDDNQELLALTKAEQLLFSVGLTSIVDAGVNERDLEFLRNLYTSEKLKIRNYAMIEDNLRTVRRMIRSGYYDDGRLHIRAVKLTADGLLRTRDASLLTPYSDDSTTRGFLLQTPEELERTIKEIAATNFQLSTRAVGDSAARLILDLYGKYLGQNNERRWRIEHAQVVNELDFEKFDRFRVFPSLQPANATSDMYWVKNRIGEERLHNAYALKRLVDNYGMLAIGSGFPGENFNPLNSFHAAVTRVDANGLPEGGFEIKNALTRREALMGMTIWAAQACFQETRRGNIQRGKDADFVILSQDIMTIPDGELRRVAVLRTVINGETVYQKK